MVFYAFSFFSSFSPNCPQVVHFLSIYHASTEEPLASRKKLMFSQQKADHLTCISELTPFLLLSLSLSLPVSIHSYHRINLDSVFLFSTCLSLLSSCVSIQKGNLLLASVLSVPLHKSFKHITKHEQPTESASSTCTIALVTKMKLH